MDKRDHSIDIAKGLGIFLVVYGHIAKSEDYSNLLIYSFHMPLFFLLSGVFHKQQISFFQLIKSKSRSLLLPYVFFSLFAYFFYLVWVLIFGDIKSFDFESICRIIPYNATISVTLWFFISLFEVTIIYYLLKRSIKNSKVLLLVTLVISIFSYCISQLYLSYFYNYFYIFSSFSALFFYALGSEVFKNFRARMIPNHIIFKVIFLLVIVNFFVYVNTFSKGIDFLSNTFYSSFVVYIVAALTGIYALWLFAKIACKVNFISDLWVFVGKNSMGVFAIHMGFLSEISRPLAKIIITPTSIMSGFVITVLTLIISLGVNEVLKIIFPLVYGLKREKLILN